MKKKTKEVKRNISMEKFLSIYKVSDDILVNSIPIKHPQTGEKIYYAGSMNMDHWYRKKPNQTKGRIWPLCDSFFNALNAEVHDDIKEELGGKVGIFKKNSAIVR